MLIVAAILLITIGIAHSYLGERYLLIRLFKRELPKLLGSDEFTKQVLRFAWHLTTVAWFGFAAILVVLQGQAPNKLGSTLLLIIAATFLTSGMLSFFSSKGKHYSYIVFWAVAAICAYISFGA